MSSIEGEMQFSFLDLRGLTEDEKQTLERQLYSESSDNYFPWIKQLDTSSAKESYKNDTQAPSEEKEPPDTATPTLTPKPEAPTHPPGMGPSVNHFWQHAHMPPVHVDRIDANIKIQNMSVPGAYPHHLSGIILNHQGVSTPPDGSQPTTQVPTCQWSSDTVSTDAQNTFTPMSSYLYQIPYFPPALTPGLIPTHFLVPQTMPPVTVTAETSLCNQVPVTPTLIQNINPTTLQPLESVTPEMGRHHVTPVVSCKRDVQVINQDPLIEQEPPARPVTPLPQNQLEDEASVEEEQTVTSDQNSTVEDKPKEHINNDVMANDISKPENVEEPKLETSPAEASSKVETSPVETSSKVEDATTTETWSKVETSPAGAWSQPKKWSSVFQKPVAKVLPTRQIEEKQNQEDSVEFSLGSIHPRIKELHACLMKHTVEHHPTYYKPRGLMNKANWCYVNSVLQALLACPPFANLLKALPKLSQRDDDEEKSPTPIIDTMVEFFNEFEIMKRPVKYNNINKDDVEAGTAFEPSNVYQMLAALQSDTYKVEGRQEDAEEFLSHVLNGLHEEMIEALKLSSGKSKETIVNGQADEDDDWQEVKGSKRRPCVTRVTQTTQTPVSRMFQGQIRSVLHPQGGQATATLQPFFSLQLDIQLDIQGEGVTSVQNALQNLVSKEMLDGFTCQKTRQEVTAHRQLQLEELPPVLILHLKRFVYDPTTGASNKLMTRVDFPVSLTINKELMSAESRGKLGVKQKRYRLFGVVYHTGHEVNKGHYITDVFHMAYRGWLRFNDAEVKCITEETVFKHNPPSVPYILLYRREDTAQKSNN